MKIYFAHSFSSHSSPMPLKASLDHELRSFLSRLTELGVTVIDPAETHIPVSDPNARYQACLQDIRSCELLLVDARNRLGVGVGAEMMFAKEHCVPVFAVLPSDSYYRFRDENGTEGVHAFIQGIAESVFAGFDECLAELKRLNRMAEDNNGGRRL